MQRLRLVVVADALHGRRGQPALLRDGTDRAQARLELPPPLGEARAAPLKDPLREAEDEDVKEGDEEAAVRRADGALPHHEDRGLGAQRRDKGRPLLDATQQDGDDVLRGKGGALRVEGLGPIELVESDDDLVHHGAVARAEAVGHVGRGPGDGRVVDGRVRAVGALALKDALVRQRGGRRGAAVDEPVREPLGAPRARRGHWE